MVPAATAFLVLDLSSLAAAIRAGRAGGLHLAFLARSAPVGLACVFYGLIIIGYLRRGPASATSGSLGGCVAAVAGTLLPLALPLLPGTAPGVPRAMVAGLLGLAGMAWAIWALSALGRNLSVLAQAREVADRGPYRLVRHPLYTGELACALGIAIGRGSAAAAGSWLACCALQTYRARQEELLLRQVLPAYRGYAGRTPALLPGIGPLRAQRYVAGGGGGPGEPVGDQRR